MKAVLQRVKYAKVDIDGKTVGEISRGILILVGVLDGDTDAEVKYLSAKIPSLRIFEDQNRKMNCSVLDVDGEVLVVPNFTLCANAKKGNRPSYIASAPPDVANSLFEYFCDKLEENGVKTVERGIFGGDMQVELVNDGPVTLILDTAEIMPSTK